MCVPLAVAAIAMSVVGAGVSAYGAVKQGQDAKAAADYNADAQRKTAISVENQGAQQAADKRQQMRRVEASQIAAGAANGLRTDTGTALNLAGETAAFGELDALRITNNAARSAWGYQTQASLDEWQGKQAQTAGYLKGAGSLLSGASNAYFGAKKFSDGGN